MFSRTGRRSFILRRLAGQRGAFLVTTALFAVPLLGLAVLSTDIGMAYLVRTEMFNGTDLTSLAAIKRFAASGGDIDEATLLAVRQAAAVTGELNTTRYRHYIHVDTSPYTGAESSPDGVVFGFYDHDDEVFTIYTDSEVLSGTRIVNAVRTRITLGEGENEPFLFQFARFLNKHNSAFSKLLIVSESVASFGLMNIVPVIDISASMDNRTYRTTEACRHSVLFTNRSRWFHFAARPDAYGECENEPGTNVIGPQNPDYGVVPPEPLTAAFRVLADVLLDRNRLFKGLYRGGLIVYETLAYAPYVPGGQSVELNATSLSNKENIKSVINFSIAEWQSYAQAGPYENSAAYEALSLAYPNLAFPGGLDPPESTFTNTGDAIFLGVQWITAANEATKTQTANLQIVLSDGLPNCYRPEIDNPESADFSLPPLCPRTNEIMSNVQELMVPFEETADVGRLANPDFDWNGWLQSIRQILVNARLNHYDSMGEQWSMSNAIRAANYGIVIHTIYFGTDDECAPDNPGYNHLKAVAEVTGGQGYCADNIEELSSILEDLSLKQSFVLVTPQGTRRAES